MSGTDAERRAAPNRLPWPPVLYLAAIVAAVVANRFWPIAVPGRLGERVVGCAGLIIGASLDIAAMLAMARAKTNVLPTKPALHLVTDGVFRRTRNPIYLGNTIMTASAALAVGNVWFLPAALVAAIATHHLAILREEEHLRLRFGSEWDDYAGRTPRWLLV